MAVVCVGTLALLAFRIFLQHDARFQRQFREMCFSLGWSDEASSGSDAAGAEAASGEAPTVMGVSLEGFSGVATACLNAVLLAATAPSARTHACDGMHLGLWPYTLKPVAPPTGLPP